MASEDITARLQALAELHSELQRQIAIAEATLHEADMKIADFKRRQNLRLADEPIEAEHKRRISDAGHETGISPL